MPEGALRARPGQLHAADSPTLHVTCTAGRRPRSTRDQHMRLYLPTVTTVRGMTDRKKPRAAERVAQGELLGRASARRPESRQAAPTPRGAESLARAEARPATTSSKSKRAFREAYALTKTRSGSIPAQETSGGRWLAPRARGIRLRRTPRRILKASCRRLAHPRAALANRARPKCSNTHEKRLRHR